MERGEAGEGEGEGEQDRGEEGLRDLTVRLWTLLIINKRRRGFQLFTLFISSLNLEKKLCRVSWCYRLSCPQHGIVCSTASRVV